MSKRQKLNTVIHGTDPNTGAPKYVSAEGVDRIKKSSDDKILKKYEKVYGPLLTASAVSQVTKEEEMLKDDNDEQEIKRREIDPVAPDVPSGGKRRRLGRSQKRYNVSGHYTKGRGNKKRNTKRRGLSRRRRRRGTHRK
jgi:hypothetical protein